MLKSIITFHQALEGLVRKGMTTSEIKELSIYQELMRMKTSYTEDDLDRLEKMPERILETLKELDF